jgi:hypothetical protein
MPGNIMTRLGGNGAARPQHRGGIEDLKVRADLLAFARPYVTLKQRGQDWWGCCPFHAERTPSFKISPRHQAFYCFGCGAKGDVIDFAAALEALDTGAAIRRVREFVDKATLNPAAAAARAARMAAVAAKEAAEAAERQRQALEIWRASEPITTGLPFDYLTQRRGIPLWDCDRLRWHPACPWGLGTAGCIVACVNDHATGYVAGIWRIKPVMSGPVERRSLGPKKGNTAQLFPADGPRLVVAEGIENALVAHVLTALPAWAALTAENMGALELPARFTEILIVADNDRLDARGRRVGPDNAHRLAERLRAEGRYAIVRRTAAVKDVNDLLLAGRGT